MFRSGRGGARDQAVATGGHVEAALAIGRRLELSRLLAREPSRERALCLAMIVQRVLALGSKLAMSRAFSQSTPASKLGVAGAPQIVYGLVCAPDGCPVAVEVFEGSLHDDKTLPAQIEKLKQRFGLDSVIVVLDRGTVTKANLELLRATERAAWITALKAPQVKPLVKVKDGDRQLSLFDEHNLAEIASDHHRRSGSWSAATRSSLTTGRASARTCSKPPSAPWRRSQGASSRARSAARQNRPRGRRGLEPGD